MISENSIRARISQYSRCMGRYTVSKYAARAVGNDQQEALMYHREKLMWWASEVLKAHVFGGQWCPTDDEVCCAVGIADPLCVKCACEPVQTIPNLPPCYVTPDFTANFAVDANQESSAVPGSTYYIVSNVDGLTTGWGLRVGEIAVGNVFQLPTFGQITLVGGGTYWLQTSTTPALYWPGIGATVVPDTSISIVSDYPMAAYVLPRTIIIETSVTGNDPWVEIYNDTEAGLFTGLDISIDDTPTAIRITYVEGDCRYGPFAGRLPLEIPTNSFRISPVSLAAYIAPIDGGIMDFNPADESQFVISFNVKATYIDPTFNVFLPLTLIAQKQNPGAACVSVGLLFFTSTYLSQQEYGFVMSVEPVVGPTVGGGIIFPGAYAAAFDGSWHNVTIVRDATTPGTLAAGDFSMWVDNIRYAAVLDPGFVSGSYPVPTGVTYFPSAGYGLQPQQIGDTFAFNTDFIFNNFYIAAYAPSPVEIASICYPAAYEGNDGSWSRRLWIRAKQPDNLVASPWVNGNSPFSSAWQEGSPGDGGVTLVPDAPPWV